MLGSNYRFALLLVLRSIFPTSFNDRDYMIEFVFCEYITHWLCAKFVNRVHTCYHPYIVDNYDDLLTNEHQHKFSNQNFDLELLCVVFVP
jgi:hypothetical protein